MNLQTSETDQLLVAFTTNIMCRVRFEVFTAVTMKKAVFWDVAPWLLHGVTSQKTAFFIMCRVIFPIFLLKARYDERRGW
jgi:hypothetical protein